MVSKDEIKKYEIKKCQNTLKKIRNEISKIVIGQEVVVDAFLRAILCDGHALVEGVPGIAKTTLIRALAAATGCEHKRIQFTVDLLPADIIGLTIYSKEKEKFVNIKGPIFANFILADEINRAPPKTQSAMLECMQEKSATIEKVTYPLPVPFFVMATQNPLEQEGVYPLPEAQIDRFLFKILMGYPKPKEEEKIVDTNITIHKFEEYDLKPVTSPKDIMKMQAITKQIYASPEICKYIVEIVNMTRDREKFALGKYVDWGGSPRASIGMYIASKASALMEGSSFVKPQNVKDVAYDVLRHRIILNYEGRAEGITSEAVIKEILSKVPVP
ncbi:MAG: MoxR family ATPase [Candidatus Woesearchaeota archaeon]|nr:MAG: MoxR family ATPase [Candidatus Woesearchaeota archaeon]